MVNIMAKKPAAAAKPAAKKKAAPAKKAAGGKRGGYIAKAPIRRLMKNEGAELVAESAVTLLIAQLEMKGDAITKEAIKLVKADKRKRVTAADITAAQ